MAGNNENWYYPYSMERGKVELEVFTMNSWFCTYSYVSIYYLYILMYVSVNIYIQFLSLMRDPEVMTAQ